MPSVHADKHALLAVENYVAVRALLECGADANGQRPCPAYLYFQSPYVSSCHSAVLILTHHLRIGQSSVSFNVASKSFDRPRKRLDFFRMKAQINDQNKIFSHESANT